MPSLRTGRIVVHNTACGEPFQAYVAGDENAERGVLLFHEWGGLRDHNRDWADWLACKGYRCVALDLYNGRVTDNAEEASHWMQALDQARADRMIQESLTLMQGNIRSIGTLGFSMGGKQALRAALIAPQQVRAVVAGYCRLESNAHSLRVLQAPVLAIYAEKERAWPEKQRVFEAAMQAAGKQSKALRVKAAHGFTNPGSERYDQEAMDTTWKAMLEFFDHQLT